MRSRDVITLVRQKVNDVSVNFFQEVEAYAALNMVHRELFRRKAEADETWGTCDYAVLANSSRVVQFSQSQWLYRLPSWVYRVNRVRNLRGNVDSPGNITGDEITFREMYDTKPGWRFKDDRSIILTGFTTAPSVKLEVIKVPALLLYGTVLSLSSIDALKVDIAQGLHNFELEDGAAINMQVEITSKISALDARGTVAAVTSTSRNGSTLTLNISPPFTQAPNPGDSFDCHLELSDAHIELVVLRVAESLLMRHTDPLPVSLLRDAIKRAEARFVESLQPRYQGGPRGTALGFGYNYDPDRDPDSSPGIPM